MVLVLLFLNALLTIPVTINFAKVDSFPLEDFYPKTIQLIDQQTIEALAQADYENGEMIFSEPFIIEQDQGLVAGGLALGEIKDLPADTKLLFQENQFHLSEAGAPAASVLYTRDFTLAGATTTADVVDELSRQWFNQNRILIVLIFSLMLSVFLLVMHVLVIFGSALFLYFTKNSPITTITTYKESVNLLLNVLALPTFVALIYGLFFFDIIMMITIQTVGLIIMLFIIYYKTQFNDAKLEPIENIAEKRGK